VRVLRHRAGDHGLWFAARVLTSEVAGRGMTNARFTIFEGRQPALEPQIGFWLEVSNHGVALVAKHNDDVSDQRVIQIEIVDGKLVIFQQALAARHLCDAFGIPQKTRPRIFRWSDRGRNALADILGRRR
jgi:hypothetical protein